jgi:hypothetical protein
MSGRKAVISILVKKRIYIPLLCTVALATGSQLAFATSPPTSIVHTQNPGGSDSNAGAGSRSKLSGVVENNNGQFRLNLTNHTSREFRGVGIIGIGDDSEQREIGQLRLALPPQEAKLFQLSGLSASGNQFSIKIFDHNGALVLYKIAPIKNVSDSSPAISVTLDPVSNSKRRSATLSSVEKREKVKLSSTNTLPTINVSDSPLALDEVTIKRRLLAGQSETEPFIIAFEINAIRPIREATLSVTLGKFKDRKPVNIPNIQQNLIIEFKPPEEFNGERLVYELTDKNGRLIARGELNVEQLMAEDVVTVADIRTDRASYDPGETAQVTVLLEGKSPNGFRLEAQVKDSSGSLIFHDQTQSDVNNPISARVFTVTLPRELTAPVSFEFKIYDNESGLLSDSGEREIPVKAPKRRP